VRVILTVAVCATLALLAGCDGEEPAKPHVPMSEASAPAVVDSPAYKASLFINLHTVAPTTGARGAMANEYNRSSMIACGSPGAVSEVTWEFLHHKDGQDVYRVTRRFSVDLPNPSVETKEVAYDGTELVVFEDAVHRITMYPSTDGANAPTP